MKLWFWLIMSGACLPDFPREHNNWKTHTLTGHLIPNAEVVLLSAAVRKKCTREAIILLFYSFVAQRSMVIDTLNEHIKLRFILVGVFLVSFVFCKPFYTYYSILIIVVAFQFHCKNPLVNGTQVNQYTCR